jgi:hypothetical protein
VRSITGLPVHVTLPNGVTRTAKCLGSQGCVTLPLGEPAVIGWAVLYGVVRALLTDGSDASSRMFDKGRWPLAILFGWPALYWLISHGVIGAWI